MQIINQAIFSLREAWRGFNYHPFISLFVVSAITLSLIVGGVFAFGVLNVNRTLAAFEEKVELEAYLEDGAADVDRIRRELQGIPGIAVVSFVSSTEALKLFAEEWGAEFVEELEANPLPSSFKLKIDRAYKSQQRIAEIQNQARNIQGVQEISNPDQWLPRLESLRGYLLIAAIILGLVISVIIYLTVTATLKLTILDRRDLVEIMSLVGASEMNVQLPFFIEGMLKGLLGGLLAAFATGLGFWLIQRHFPGVSISYLILPGQVLSGLGLGVMGSLSAIYKYF
jgi:cell division transport system permease protein